ncbi:tripartite tricarboxylate transporter TctB family protein [Microvirga antarctica]|uniref:tripartite tricarboxylate transporter TctB family protein n=1 Tax=Microvirga antarctica TaxID=2819233 RepID=UPI001B30BDD2|nr:tripartite tricarboxylate transporter TctB family protein [Microvirga antarctica]
MTTRHANWVFLAGFILVGAFYVYDSLVVAASNEGAGLGPVKFPIVLGLMLIALSLADVFVSVRKRDVEDDELLEVRNAEKLLMTIILTGLYFTVWSVTGQFYPTTAIFFFVLVMLYQPNRTLRTAATVAVVSALFTTALYLVFGLAFSVQMT